MHVEAEGEGLLNPKLKSTSESVSEPYDISGVSGLEDWQGSRGEWIGDRLGEKTDGGETEAGTVKGTLSKRYRRSTAWCGTPLPGPSWSNTYLHTPPAPPDFSLSSLAYCATHSVGQAKRASLMSSSTRSGSSSGDVCEEMSYARRRAEDLERDWQMARIRRTRAGPVHKEAGSDQRRDSAPQSPIINGCLVEECKWGGEVLWS